MKDLTKDLEFIWFKGVVENRNDPMKLGRCRVRCLGFRTENKSLLPTDDLPWAFPIQPITSAAMNGIGQTPIGPVEGTWVFGFFMDGKSCQQPVIMGTMGGVPEEAPNSAVGFNDPNAKYPKEEFLDALKDLDSLMDNLSPDQEDTESESGETQEEV